MSISVISERKLVSPHFAAFIDSKIVYTPLLEMTFSVQHLSTDETSLSMIFRWAPFFQFYQFRYISPRHTMECKPSGISVISPIFKIRRKLPSAFSPKSEILWNILMRECLPKHYNLRLKQGNKAAETQHDTECEKIMKRERLLICFEAYNKWNKKKPK